MSSIREAKAHQQGKPLRVFPNGFSREDSLELILRNNKGKAMLKTTVKKVFASYNEAVIQASLSEAKTRINNTVVKLEERVYGGLMDPDEFRYHYYIGAHRKGIQRVAKRFGMEARDLEALVYYFYPEGFY